MGEEIERDPNYFCTGKFPFLPIPVAATMHSPDHPSSGMATPPLQTLASVPFKWEEEPGKPRPCTDIIALPAKRLELELPHPPCRMEPRPCTEMRMPSPNAVLDGPYSNVVGGRPKFYSFRLLKGSFDSSSSDQTSRDESNGSDHVEDVLFGKRMKRRRYWFLKLKKSAGRKEAADGGGSSFGSDHERCSRKMRRSGSARSSTHLWAAVYQSLKQVIPWKSTGKSKKDGSI